MGVFYFVAALFSLAIGLAVAFPNPLQIGLTTWTGLVLVAHVIYNRR